MFRGGRFVKAQESSLAENLAFGAPIELGELKIIPAYRSLVSAMEYGALAVVSPAAVIVVRGVDVKVLLLKESTDLTEKELLESYQGG